MGNGFQGRRGKQESREEAAALMWVGSAGGEGVELLGYFENTTNDIC